MNKPTPTIDKSAVNVDTKNQNNEPTNGILKTVTDIKVIKSVSISAIHNGGTVFPTRISKDVRGLTISWSKVPNSLSLAIDIAVSSTEIINASMVIKDTSKNQRYSKLGLNQFLIEVFTIAPRSGGDSSLL